MAGLPGFPTENGNAHDKHEEMNTRREIVICRGICNHAKRCPGSRSEVAPARLSTASKFPTVSGEISNEVRSRGIYTFHVFYSIYHISPPAIAE